MSDLSQVFLPADILGVIQAIKGFDKLDFCELISTSQRIDIMWHIIYLI